MSIEDRNNTRNKGMFSSTFKPEYTKQMLDFFNKQPFALKQTKEGKVIREVTICPSFLRFALQIGVTRCTLRKWSYQTDPVTGELSYPEFSQAYRLCKEIAAEIIIENGLLGNYAPQIVQFVLKNRHGMVDKIETVNSNTNKNIGPTDEELDEFYKSATEKAKAKEAEQEYLSRPDADK